MTVAELIEALKQLPPDTLVLKHNARHDEWRDVSTWWQYVYVVQQMDGVYVEPRYSDERMPIEALEI